MLFPISTINTDFALESKLIYGYPKSGKSTLASMMQDESGRIPLFLATEDGHNSLPVSRVRLSTWEGFVRCIDHLEKNKDQVANEYSTIVVDLVSDLDQWCSTYIAQQKKVEYVGDLDMGKGWKLLKDQFQQQISRLFALKPVTFIAHTQDKKIMWNGVEITTQAPDLSKGALAYVNGKVGAIMFIVPASTKKEFPEVTMQQSTGHIAGARQKSICRYFKYDPANPRAVYQEIAAAYKAGQQAEIDRQSAAPVAAAQ